MVQAQFRADYGRFIEDPWWATQITELSRISPEFRELWASHDLRGVPEDRKSLHHLPESNMPEVRQSLAEDCD